MGHEDPLRLLEEIRGTDPAARLGGIWAPAAPPPPPGESPKGRPIASTSAGSEAAERVRASFHRQGFMGLLGAELVSVSPGFCEIRLAFRPRVSQQHGFFHGGVIGTLCDNAVGYAAMSLAPPDCSVLAVEYKVNFVAPGEGDRLIARARVVKPGRTLVVTDVEAFVVRGGREHLCATALATIMLLPGRVDGPAPERRRSGHA